MICDSIWSGMRARARHRNNNDYLFRKLWFIGIRLLIHRFSDRALAYSILGLFQWSYISPPDIVVLIIRGESRRTVQRSTFNVRFVS